MKLRDRIKDFRRVKASDLQPNPRNWRTHPQAQQDALRGVLAEVGIADALIVRELADGSLRLVDGHLRGDLDTTTEWPCLILDINDEEEAKLLVSLDPLAAMAEVDWGNLEGLLADVDTESEALQSMFDDLADEHGDGEDVTEGLTDADAVPEPPEEPITKTGDLWLLGEHRLLCGDSTKAEDVERLLDGRKPFIMVTDPPYGVGLDQSWRDAALGEKAMGPGNKHRVANDDRADWRECWSLFTGDVAYIWHASKYSDIVMESLRASGFVVCQQLIWNKSIMVMGRSDYHFKHEPCWYATRKGKPHGWIGDRKQTTVIEAKSPNHIMAGSDEEKTEHPTQKPAACFGMIANHNGDVYDPFCGSGTTIIAAETLGRRCYAIEIDPIYCDVAAKRWEEFTGKKAERQTT